MAALFLGIFFAMQSGTVESVVYDTLLEETGDSAAFERTIGGVRLVGSVALVGSALAGGVIAQFLSLRVTYFLTVPLLVASCVALLVFREPRLHKAEEAEPLRRQLVTTWQTIVTDQPDQRCIELVGLLSAYVDHTLPEPARAAFDAHLATCPGCRAAVAQWRAAIALVGRLRPEDVASLDAYTRDRFLAALTTPRRR